MDTKSIITKEIAQRTILGCWEDYTIHLKKELNISKSAICKDTSAILPFLKHFEVPIMNITNGIAIQTYNDMSKCLCLNDSDRMNIASILNAFFHWAKENNDGRRYTIHTIEIPCNDAVTDNTANSKSYATHSSKEIRTSAISAKDMAIFLLLTKTNLTIDELIDLNIYDFCHTHMIIHDDDGVQSHLMTIDVDIRNAIYAYLKNRKDLHINKYLFGGDKFGRRITANEVNNILINVGNNHG